MTDRDTLAALIDDWAMGTEDEIRTIDLADRILASDWLAGRDRRGEAQTLRDAADAARHGRTPEDSWRWWADWLDDRADTTEGTHHG